MRFLIALFVLFGVIQQSGAVVRYSCGSAHARFNENYFNYLFGLEFTFTNQDIVDEGNRNPADPGIENNPLKGKALENFWNEITRECASVPGCRTSFTNDKHGKALKAQFDDGFYMTVGMDSAVLEVNAKPATPKDFKSYADRLDKFAFSIAKKVGLSPHQRAGQGHIHISVDAFEGDARLFRNFFVDFQNRPEIIYGALGNHLLNSPPLAAQQPEQRAALVEVLKEIDGKKFLTIQELVQELESKVYTSSYSTEWGSFSYYQAFNMTRISRGYARQRTVEIRSFRPQQSTKEFQLQTKLLAAWVDRLKHETDLIPYNNKSRYNYSAQEIVDSFYELIRYLDLPWNEYMVLLPETHRNIQPSALKRAHI